MTRDELLQYWRAQREVVDATIAAIERGEVGNVPNAFPKRQGDGNACPKCGAPKHKRTSYGGFGGSKQVEICGACSYEFS